MNQDKTFRDSNTQSSDCGQTLALQGCDKTFKETRIPGKKGPGKNQNSERPWFLVYNSANVLDYTKINVTLTQLINNVIYNVNYNVKSLLSYKITRSKLTTTKSLKHNYDNKKYEK